MNRCITTCILIVVSLPLPACRAPDKKDPTSILKGKVIGKVTQLQLREELKDFADRFAVMVEGAANEIQARSPEPVTCARAVYWQLFTIPSVRRSAVAQNPVAGLVDIWSFCKQHQAFFRQDEESFGEYTPVAREVSDHLVTDITHIASDTIPDEIFESVEKAIDGFVAKHPISSSLARRSLRPAMVQASDAKSLMWVTELPLAPLRVFMDDSAKALREFTLVVDSLATYARTVPDVMRWQTQLLLYDVETRPTTATLLTNFESVASSFHSLVDVAKGLPHTLREELTAALDDAAAKQAEVRETLKEVQATLSSADKTLTNAASVAATLEQTAKNVDSAGERWHRAVDAADGLVARFTEDDEAADSASGRPHAPRPTAEEGFDINDYTETAVRAEAAVARMHSLLESDAATALVDRIVWRGALLIVVFFGSLLTYRIAVHRLRRRTPVSSEDEQDSGAWEADSKSSEGHLDHRH